MQNVIIQIDTKLSKYEQLLIAQVLAEQHQNITVMITIYRNCPTGLPVKQLMEQWACLPEEFYQDYQTKFNQLHKACLEIMI